MCTIKQCMFTSVISVAGVIALIVLLKASRRNPNLCEKTGKLIDSLLADTNNHIDKICTTCRQTSHGTSPDVTM